MKAALLVLCLILAGCATPYGEPRIIPKASAGDALPVLGVADYLSTAGTVDVLIVHGMCSKPDTWPTSVIAEMHESLGGASSEVEVKKLNSTASGIGVYQSQLQAFGGTLRISAIHWSPATRTLKDQLCFDQSTKSANCSATEVDKPYGYKRALVNKFVKDSLLNDCLSDAMIYQGRARDEINAEMRLAILSALAGSSERSSTPRQLAQVVAAMPEANPILFVSDSLGSKIAFDAIMKLQQAPATKSAGDRIAARTQQIFMRANQLPILALADQPLGGGKAALLPEDSYSSDPLAALAALRSRAKSAARPPGAQISKAMDAPLRVVAFTDPNDLLSYSLAKSPHFDSSAYSIVDVIVSNAPTYLGLLEMPTTAHVGYTSNAAVKRLIACGSLGSACQQP